MNIEKEATYTDLYADLNVVVRNNLRCIEILTGLRDKWKVCPVMFASHTIHITVLTKEDLAEILALSNEPSVSLGENKFLITYKTTPLFITLSTQTKTNQPTKTNETQH